MYPVVEYYFRLALNNLKTAEIFSSKAPTKISENRQSELFIALYECS